MHANSRQVSSNQPGLHPRLVPLVRKHLAHAYRPPLAQHNLDAYARLQAACRAQQRPLVLDSFCGSGHSTAALARRHPDCLVVGVDKSSHRLGRGPQPQPDDNYLLLQADCEAVWQLLAADGITLHYHYLLYPNPWPKAAHVKRRVHGHPGFATLLEIGGELELRSNWQLYVEEFGVALWLAGRPALVKRLTDEAAALTLFEHKYRASGHTLWCLRSSLAP
ncbi:MAG: SAM-dependent methyltransferase [Halioglobus sp.]|nr:SAM-dependent methyltransferase [Halioglobus sp.]